jgi:hypothetical protein
MAAVWAQSYRTEMSKASFHTLLTKCHTKQKSRLDLFTNLKVIFGLAHGLKGEIKVAIG